MSFRFKNWVLLGAYGMVGAAACAGTKLNDVGDVNTVGEGGSGSGDMAPAQGGDPAGGGARVTASPTGGAGPDTGGKGAVGPVGGHVAIIEGGAPNPVDEITCEDCTELAEVNDIRALAVTADTIYWVEHGSFDELGNHEGNGELKSVPTAGGSAVVLADSLEGPVQLGLSQQFAYVLLDESNATDGQEGLLRLPLAGGTPELVQSLDPDRDETALLDGENWFYTHFAAGSGFSAWLDDGTVYRIAEAAGADLENVAVATGATALFGDASQLYLRDEDGFWTMPYGGSDRSLLQKFPSSLSQRYEFFSVSGSFIYGVEANNAGQPTNHYLVRMPKTGGSWERLLDLPALAFGLHMSGDDYALNSPPLTAGGFAGMRLLRGNVADAGSLKPAVTAPFTDTWRYWHAWGISTAGIFFDLNGKLHRAPLAD